MAGYYSNGYGNAREDATDRYGGYTNGYTNGYRHEEETTRRPGGYGGFGVQDSHRTPNYGSSQRVVSPYSQRPRRAGSEAQSVGRSFSGAGPAEKQIEDILRHIKREWAFMTEDKCVPVQVALQLLDPSSLGLAAQAREFQDVQQQLQSALKAVVNEHHQDFNTAVGQFHQIQGGIQSSHQRVQDLKAGLILSKTNLLSSKPEYQNLITSSRNYAAMLDKLHTIEQIQNIPVRLEASMSDKRFLSAVDMLQEALQLIRKPELEDIGALSEMKVYLSNQEHSLTDILTEELHNHLYLKSPYCEERWQQYTRVATGSNVLASSGTRRIYDFLEELDTSTPLTDDSSRNPEGDSFHYIHVIVESLTKLGRLSEAVDSIEERLPVELFKIVERSNNEIQQRYPSALRGDWKADSNANELPSLNQTDTNILRELLDTLYAKFEAIAEAHRVFHDVAAGICRREGTAEASEITRGFKELWKLYQSEMRSLLHDYLSTGGDGHRFGQSSASEGNIFRVQRDKNKKCNFKMDLVDTQAADLKPSREELVTTWQKFVPGLVSLSQQDADLASATTFGAARIDTSAAGHKLLVRPSVFNISCLLPQSVTFLNRLKEVVPPDTDIPIPSLTNFLNDFLINVFHPQLEDTLTDFCSQSFTQLDAFQPDPQWQKHSQKQIFRGTVKFYGIVTAFCRMLDDLTHDQSFTQLLITQMNTYYDKCGGWKKALVSRVQAEGDGRQIKAAAYLAEHAEVIKAVERVQSSSSDKEMLRNMEVEHSLLHSMLPSRRLTEADLISDSKSQSQLCLVNTSMMWLASKLNDLRHISDRATNANQRRDSNLLPVQRSLTSDITENNGDGTEQVYLPLSSESADLFDGIITAYRDLAEESLRTLHLEMRCQVFYRLSTAIRGSFLYAERADSPDEDVLALSSDLLKFDRETKSLLRAKDHTFVGTGISRFVDSTFVHAIMKNVLSANEAGNDQFQLNARVLYHNLSNIEPTSDLTRCFRFFELFEQGPEATLQAARQYRTGLTKDELKKLLELRASKDMESADRQHALSAKRLLDDQLSRLDQIPKPSG